MLWVRHFIFSLLLTSFLLMILILWTKFFAGWGFGSVQGSTGYLFLSFTILTSASYFHFLRFILLLRLPSVICSLTLTHYFTFSRFLLTSWIAINYLLLSLSCSTALSIYSSSLCTRFTTLYSSPLLFPQPLLSFHSAQYFMCKAYRIRTWILFKILISHF